MVSKSKALDPESLSAQWRDFVHNPTTDDTPDIAYHYTDAAGLYGLLNSKVIHATDKLFLNDRLEVHYGISLTKDLIGRLRADPKARRGTLKEIEETVGGFDDERHFVFSMSERPDDLSQWRGYGNDGDGFSIGFDAKKIRVDSLPSEALFAFNRVNYSQSSFIKNIRNILDDFVELEDKFDRDEISHYAASAIGAHCSFFKHHSFRNEREWRMMSYVYNGSPEKISVKQSNGKLKPYIEIPLCAEAEALPIKRIGIGPSVRNPNTRIAIRDLCNLKGIDVEIYDAATPYVRY